MVNPAGGSGELEGRDSWWTPAWLAELIGDVGLDPCSNSRSHIRAAVHLSLERGQDGLDERHTFTGPTFVNPPYARGQVIRWVRHWRESRFIFLLRWDPSTEWFKELLPWCTFVWFPNRRINFEPPPGVKASSNPFPHALFLRDPTESLLDRLIPEGYLLDTFPSRVHGGAHVDTTNAPAGGYGSEPQTGPGGGAKRALSARGGDRERGAIPFRTDCPVCEAFGIEAACPVGR
jgi:hypothetical protein